MSKSINIGAQILGFVVLSGLAAAACAGNVDDGPGTGSAVRARPDERVGSVGLKLLPVASITISSVHYAVTAGSPAATPAPAVVAEGSLPTPGTAESFSFGIPLPVGTGYVISITAQSAEAGDDISCTGSFGPFSVAPNDSTQFSMVLTCVDLSNGQILSTVDVSTDACPRLVVDYAVAQPSSAQVGETVDVDAAAHDLDNPAEPIDYVWSIVDPAQASVGQFAPVNSRGSRFRCSNSRDSVRIKVTATNHECSKSLETIVSCGSGDGCGNGVVDPGETCDPSLDHTCPADCTRVCGDGIAESGEECDPLPASAAVCIPPGEAGECTLRVPVCGDGFRTPPEVCDTREVLPPEFTCLQNCTVLDVGSCGNGIVSGAEECDDAGTSRTCSAQCQRIATEACVACEQAGDCFASSDNCLGVGGAFSPAQQKTCTDVMQCMEDSGCLAGTGSLGKCYCGTLSTAACGAAPYDLSLPGAPNGPCAAIMQAGNPGVTSNSAILGGLTNKSRPAGAAGQRLNCDKNDPACTAACGLQ